MLASITKAIHKVFGRAIHAIARISDEFWLNPTEKGRYTCTNVPELYLNKNRGQPTCKLIIKAILPVFRCLNNLERNVEKCNIYTNFNDCHVVFQLFCKHGIVKTHHLTFQDCEPLQAVFVKHLCLNVLKVQSRQLSDILIHFPTCQDEVTLAVTPLKANFKTYVEDEIDFAKTMHTEIHLSPEEFEYFQIGIDSEITFCLKELRGLLAFAESLSAPISVYFDISGKPIAFSIEDMMVEATLVLATLADIENRVSSHSPSFSQGQKRSPLLEKSSNVSSRNTQVAETAPANEDSCVMVPTDPDYHKFQSLLFGAVSPKEHDSHPVFQSLAGASDSDDNGQLSQTF